MTRLVPILRLPGCLLVLLLLAGAAMAQASQSVPDSRSFDSFADRIERGEVLMPTKDITLDLLAQLKALIPPGDQNRSLRYRYLECILGMDDDPAKGLAYAERGLQDARRIGDTDAEVNFHFCRGANQESLTTPRDALPDYNAGIAIARHAENLRLVADGLTWRGSVQSLLGEHALALVDFLEAQKFYDSAGAPIESEQNLFNIAVAYRRLGEETEARGYLDKLLGLAEGRHDVVQKMTAHMQLGFLDAQNGDQALQSARGHFETALRLAAGIKAHAAVGSAHMGLAEVFNQLGDFRAALAHLDQAKDEFALTGDRSSRDMLALQAGEAHAGLGDHLVALDDYDRAEALLEKSGNLRYLVELLEQRSRSYEALGRPVEALADMRRLVKAHAALDRKAQAYNTTLMSYQFDTARREQENRKLAADRQLRGEQVASLERVRRWQRVALALGGVLIMLLVWQALRQLRRSKRLHRMAMTDSLTGVANRRRLEHEGRRAIEQARSRGESLSLIALDIDHFKKVNDSYGHPIGDQVLVRLVSTCLKALRQIDHMGRVGGEEFVVILPGTTQEAASQVAERLRHEVAMLDLDEVAPGLRVSISLGIAELQDQNDSLPLLIARADHALYLAKQNGRDRVEMALA